MAGDSGIRGRHPEEMQQQFQNAQYHATKKISEMAQENAQLRQMVRAKRRGTGNGNGKGHQVVDRDQRVQELLQIPKLPSTISHLQ